MEQLREEAGVTEREGWRAGEGGRGGGVAAEMRRPSDEDDGCKALLAKWVPFFLFSSRAFEV